jgi:hypothetical protein
MTLTRRPAGMELIDLLDRILDKGIVIDASSRLHFISANFIQQKTHVVIASVEIHLKHSEARAVARLAGRRPLASEEHSQPAARIHHLPTYRSG